MEFVWCVVECVECEVFDVGEVFIGFFFFFELFEVDCDVINYGKYLFVGEGEVMGWFAAAGERISWWGEIGLKMD